MKKKLLIIGAGGHAASCIDLISSSTQFKVGGIVGFENELESKLLGFKISFMDSDLEYLSKKYKYALVAIGQVKSTEIRELLVRKLNDLGFLLPAVVSTRSYLANTSKVGSGTIVMSGSNINSNSIIGNHCIINSNTLLEHGVRVGHFVHVSTGVVINGGSSIGSRTFIGSGTVVRDNISVGDDVVIGMGSIILRDVPPGTIVKGKY